MKTAGMLMWIVGAALFCFGVLIFDPSVTVYGGERVANLSLMQQQFFITFGGALLFLAGVIFHAAGELIDQLKPSAHTLAPISSTTPISPARELEPSDDTELMSRYGIVIEEEKYRFGKYKYDRLADAVAYAKKSVSAR